MDAKTDIQKLYPTAGQLVRLEFQFVEAWAIRMWRKFLDPFFLVPRILSL